MKKLIIISAIAMSGLFYSTANAQIGIHVGFHFAPRRIYAAPVVVEQAPVYNSDDDYYYLPDVDAYYSINEQCYYYFDGDNWISAAYLPGEYHDYDWRNARRYEVREARPYLHNDIYRSKYNGNTANWARANGYTEGSYANRDRFNNNGYRRSDQHLDNLGGDGYSQPAQSNNTGDNRGRGYGDRGHAADNYQNRPDQGRGGYSQPTQPARAQGGNSQTSNQNRGQGSNNQPSNQNRGQSMGSRGGNEHGGQGSPQGGYADHRMARF